MGIRGWQSSLAGYPRSGAYTCGGTPLLDATEPVSADGLNFAGRRPVLGRLEDEQAVGQHLPHVRPQARGRDVPLRRRVLRQVAAADAARLALRSAVHRT